MVLFLSAPAISSEPPSNRSDNEDEKYSKTFEAKEIFIRR